jgi:hypothetical protein
MLLVLLGTSKNSGFARSDQRIPLLYQEWMETKAGVEPIFRGALLTWHLVQRRAAWPLLVEVRPTSLVLMYP